VNRAFALLWTAESISAAGSQVSALALPLTAALTLSATPLQMGLLQAVGFAPVLLFGLVAGVWVDRLRRVRRRLLIAADIGRGVLLLAAPCAAFVGVLRIEHLYAIEFLVGFLSLLFDVAYVAFLPSLIPTDRLQSANARLDLSNRVTQVGGPAVAGTLIQLIGAPIAIAADAVSFLLSGLLLSRIRCSEATPSAAAEKASVVRELREGLREVLGDPVQRALLGSAGTYNLFGYMQATVLVLYITRDLALGPALFGVSLAAFGAGGVLGALGAAQVAARVGTGRAIVAGAAIAACGDVLVALAGPPLPSSSSALLIVGRFLAGVGLPLFAVNSLSLRQTITPAALLGRTTASARWVTWGVLPVGALLGGVLGDVIGLRGTLAVAALGSSVAVLWLVRSPLAGAILATRARVENARTAPAARAA
jgi:MFS family permease